jgi:hypothetical protein
MFRLTLDLRFRFLGVLKRIAPFLQELVECCAIPVHLDTVGTFKAPDLMIFIDIDNYRMHRIPMQMDMRKREMIRDFKISLFDTKRNMFVADGAGFMESDGVFGRHCSIQPESRLLFLIRFDYHDNKIK